MDDTLTRLERQYPSIAHDLLAPLLAVLDEAEREFDGDLQKFHIVLAVALRSAAHPAIRAIVATDPAPEVDERLPSLGTNVHSLSLSLGVPEETVRRKVKALVRDGWLERWDHTLGYTLAGWRAMASLRQRLIRLAAANHQVVDKAIRPDSPKRRTTDAT
jgi:hypothetical protein